MHVLGRRLKERGKGVRSEDTMFMGKKMRDIKHVLQNQLSIRDVFLMLSTCMKIQMYVYMEKLDLEHVL